MATASKCDICGKLFDPPKYVPDIRIHVYHHGYGEQVLDLCNDCQAQLEVWIQGMPRKENCYESHD